MAKIDKSLINKTNVKDRFGKLIKHHDILLISRQYNRSLNLAICVGFTERDYIKIIDIGSSLDYSLPTSGKYYVSGYYHPSEVIIVTHVEYFMNQLNNELSLTTRFKTIEDVWKHLKGS